jgi:hypothetical protein
MPSSKRELGRIARLPSAVSPTTHAVCAKASLHRHLTIEDRLYDDRDDARAQRFDAGRAADRGAERQRMAPDFAQNYRVNFRLLS